MLRDNLGDPTTLFGRGPPRLDGPRRQSRETTRTRLSLVRNLWRLSFDVGLRTPRRAAEAQRQGCLVALDGAAPRRRGGPRCGDPDGPQGVGGQRAHRDLHGPAGGCLLYTSPSPRDGL